MFCRIPTAAHLFHQGGNKVLDFAKIRWKVVIWKPMSSKTANERIIFGLKVRQRRQQMGLSFSDLSEASGLSVSYLNEIEKGKKFPKLEKIGALAEALRVPVQELMSTELADGLAPVGDLLQSNFLRELPLDLFGIELSKVVEIIATAPKRVGAFISTLVELSRNYALQEENFYFGALRSYLEMHHNYFEEIEEDVVRFTDQHPLRATEGPPADQLARLLREEYRYEIVENGLDAYPELQDLRSVFLPQGRRLLLNSRLTGMQKAFQFGKELGFQFLRLEQRANTSSLLKVQSFEEALNHFKAGYFSAALLLPAEAFRADLQRFLQQSHWNERLLLDLLERYQASPEMLFQRMTNLLPHYFGLKQLFFLRFLHEPQRDSFRVDKELHLSRRHHPHSNGLYEHYCRRWSSLSLLHELDRRQRLGEEVGALVACQRAAYYGTHDEYLLFTLARPAYPDPTHNVSVTLGLLIDDDLKKQLRFLSDPAIPRLEVNVTCERCPIEHCTVRAAEPVVVRAKEKRREVQRTLEGLGA